VPKRSILVVSGAVLLVRLFTASRAPYPLPCASGPTVVMPCCVTIFHAGTGGASRRSGAARPRAAPGATCHCDFHSTLPGLPPGQRVVALGEIDGMPHPYPPPATRWWA
jgi:hypothetical protein